MNARWERELARVSSKAGSLEEILYPSEFVSDGIFVSKRGHVAGVVRVAPASFEVLDLAQQELICVRMEGAMRGLDPDMRLYQYLIKSENNGRYSIDIFWALVYEVRKDSDFWKWPHLPARGACVIDAEVQAQASILSTSLDNLVTAMTGVCQVERINAEDTFQFLRRLINYGEEHRGLHLTEWSNLDIQMSRSKIDAVSALTVGRSHVWVGTMEQPPTGRARKVLPGQWNGFMDIPCQFVICTEWKPVAPWKTQKLLKDLKLHFSNQLRGARSYASDMMMGKYRPAHPDEVVIDGGKKALVRELEELETAISAEGLNFGDWLMTVVLHSEDLLELRKGISLAHNTVHPHGAQLSDGLGKSALLSLLSIIPGHCRTQVRCLSVDNKSTSTMSFLFGPPKGNPRNEFLNAPYLSEWTTNQNTRYHFNLHKGQVGHGIMTGATGAGKTYTLRWLIKDSQKYKPYTVIFDVTRSFRKITQDLGGSYMELGNRNGARCNPLLLPPTEENILFNTDFFRMLMETDGGPSLDAVEMEDLHAQVKSLMTVAMPSGHRRMGNLFPKKHLVPRLAPWVNSGRHAWLFDNAEDSLSFSRLQTFSFPDMEGGREALDALLYYVLHRTLQAIQEADCPTFVWLDEAINFLENKTMREYIFKALRNWRKQEALLFAVLHSITDLPADVAKRLIAACPTRLHLANPGIDVSAWRELLNISEAEAETIRRLIPCRQLLVEGAGVMNLVAPPELDRVLATGMEKKETAA